jgi:2-(1,2-epoxy-1,2-dihydrophenyl)acetyl-CoA isomerase
LAGARSLPEIRAVVLAGVPGAFCSGADVRWLAQAVMTGGAEARSTLEQFQTLTLTIVELEKPVIAAITGPAVGFGADLALACDLRVMAESAYLQEKFVGIGLMPDGGGTYFLTRMLGVARTLELLMTGARIDSAQAASWGMTTRVTPDAETEQTALGLAKSLAAGPPLALARIKAAVHGDGQELRAALGRERDGQLALLASQDCREGVQAFIEKRPPVFRGA